MICKRKTEIPDGADEKKKLELPAMKAPVSGKLKMVTVKKIKVKS
jgi:hypothetical protein